MSGPDKMKEDFEKLLQERVPMQIFIDVGTQGKQWKTLSPQSIFKEYRRVETPRRPRIKVRERERPEFEVKGTP